MRNKPTYNFSMYLSNGYIYIHLYWTNPTIFALLSKRIGKCFIQLKKKGAEIFTICIVLPVFPSSTSSSLPLLDSRKIIFWKTNFTHLEPPKLAKAEILKKQWEWRCMKTWPLWLFIPKIECFPMPMFLTNSKTLPSRNLKLLIY